MTASLATLPYEVLKLILTLLVRENLKKIRLINQGLREIATELVFGNLTLRTSTRSGENMCFVLASEVLRNCVRDLTFDTRLFVPIGLAVERYGSRGLPKQVDYAMYHCHSFANLTSGSVRFERLSHRRFHPSPPYCSDYHAREMGLYRSNMISLLLATLMYRDPTSTHLRKISIENLQI